MNCKPKVKRSPHWPALERRYLKAHPICEVCGAKKNLAVHHKIPVHVDPTQELNIDNLKTLCESRVVNCHLLFGHLGLWKSFNVTVDADAASMNQKIRARP